MVEGVRYTAQETTELIWNFILMFKKQLRERSPDINLTGVFMLMTESLRELLTTIDRSKEGTRVLNYLSSFTWGKLSWTRALTESCT